MAHAAFRDQRVGKAAHGGGGPAQHHAFQAVLVIEMGVHGGHGEVVLPMLQGGQALGEITLVVVIDIGQVGHAMTGLATLAARLFKVGAQQVAHGLGSDS